MGNISFDFPIEEIVERLREVVRQEMASFSKLDAKEENKNLLTTTQLCDYLGITPQTLIRYKKKKKIPYIEVGSSFRFNLPDVLKALKK